MRSNAHLQKFKIQNSKPWDRVRGRHWNWNRAILGNHSTSHFAFQGILTALVRVKVVMSEFQLGEAFSTVCIGLQSIEKWLQKWFESCFGNWWWQNGLKMATQMGRHNDMCGNFPNSMCGNFPKCWIYSVPCQTLS